MQQLSFEKTKNLLEKYKIPFAKSILVKSSDQAKKTAKKIKFPLVLKLISPKIIHKTEAGAIKTGIEDEEQLIKEYEKMIKAVKKRFPKIKIQGILLQKQEQGIEVIVGMKRDHQFGPVIVFGLGGIFVEIIKDVSLRIAPITPEQSEEMIEEIKGYKILKGVRGKTKVNIKALNKIITSTSKLVLENKKIIQLDFNPVIVNQKNAIIADARIITE